MSKMSNSAKSILIFGLYIIVIGLWLVFAPSSLLALFGIPAPTDVWARVFGMLVFLLGIYYVLAARENVTAFFRWTVYVRPLVIVFFTGFVLAGFAPVTLIGAGVIDLLGAIWTGLALRGEKV